MDQSGGRHDFEAWAPLLEYLLKEEKQGGWNAGPDGLMEGEIRQRGWSIPRFRLRVTGRTERSQDGQHRVQAL